MRDALRFKLLRITEFKGSIAVTILVALFGTAALMNGETIYIIIATLIGVMTELNLLTIDEKSHMNYYVDAMPFSRRNMVNAEYIAVIITIFALIALILLFSGFLMVCFGWSPDPEIMDYELKNNLDLILTILLLIPGIVLIFASIILTGFYYDLSNVLVIMCMIVVMILAGVAALGFAWLSFDLIMFGVGAAALGLSWYTSARRNEKRDI